VFLRFRSLLLLPFALGVAFAQMPATNVNGTVNAASFGPDQPVAAGSLVAIFGTQLATGTALADTVPLSTTLGVTSVTINSIPAPLDFVTTGQINAQVPFNVFPDGTTSGSANVVVTVNGVPSPPQPVVINPVAPGVFTANGYAIAYFGAAGPNFGKFAAPVGTFPGSLPAHPGDILTVYATGLGAVNPPVQNGFNSLDQLRFTVIMPTVLIGNVQAPVQFSGLSPSFPGVYQLNITVPQVPTGNSVPLQILMNGVMSPNVAGPTSANIAVTSP
jgi:uncharacterized protein (TIGR03437 family)